MVIKSSIIFSQDVSCYVKKEEKSSQLSFRQGLDRWLGPGLQHFNAHNRFLNLHVLDVYLQQSACPFVYLICMYAKHSWLNQQLWLPHHPIEFLVPQKCPYKLGAGERRQGCYVWAYHLQNMFYLPVTSSNHSASCLSFQASGFPECWSREEFHRDPIYILS